MQASRPDGHPSDSGEPGSGRPAATGSDHFAGAVPFAVPRTALGAAEAERRHLTEADVAVIVRAEVAEREAAASQYEHAGHAGQAAGLRHGTRTLLDALDAGGKAALAAGGEAPGATDDGGVHR